jgi:hypothetical protein
VVLCRGRIRAVEGGLAEKTGCDGLKRVGEDRESESP